MKKLLFALLVVLGVSGCASTRSTANNTDPDGHCVSRALKVGDTVPENGITLKVQWISGASSSCNDARHPFKAKLVLENEFLPPPVYEDLINRGSWGKAFVLGQLGFGKGSADEQQSIKIRECLTSGNYRAWSCVPSLVANPDSVYVNGYRRADGTYVQPYYRTAPNSTKTDNYSYRGNVNPYTGKVGTQQ